MQSLSVVEYGKTCSEMIESRNMAGGEEEGRTVKEEKGYDGEVESTR